jgi:hypothetical protein
MLYSYGMESLVVLLGSACRAALLAHTHLDPHSERHLRELVRATGFAPRTVQLEVDRLVRDGILLERRNANRRLLAANRRHPLHTALRELVVRTDGLVPVLREALGESAVEFAFVFGPLATPTPSWDAAIDLLVVGPASAADVESRLTPAGRALGREIRPLVWTREEFERRLAAIDDFLGTVLKGPRLSVIKVPRRPG